MIKPFIQKYLAYLFPIVLVLAGGHGYAQNCQATTTWTLDPPPVNNEYEPGQIVEMCVTISNFIDGPAGGAWLHGITFQFPDGWDMDNVISFTPPATACGNAGTWGWYDNIFANATQQNFGPGFYFETSAGSGFVDGNPGNNWGNICTGGTWTFCIEVQLDADCGGAGNPLDGQSIVPEILVTGDGITGGFGAPSGFASGCLTHPNFTQSPNLAIDFNCCDAESGGDPGVIDICNTTTVLYDELLDPKETGGIWTDPNGVNVGNHTFVFDPDIHPPGEYTYCVLGTDDCESCTSLTMEYINLGFLPNVVYCGTTPTSIQTQYASQSVTFPHNYTGIWTLPDGVTTIPGNGPLDPLTSPEGVYVYSFNNAQNCPVTVSTNVSFAEGGSGPQGVTVNICELDPLFTPLDSFAVPGPPVVPGSIWVYFNNNPPPSNFQYTWGVNNSNPNINPSNYNNCNPPPNCTPQTMVSGYMTYSTGQFPCPTRTDTLYINMHPPTDAGEFTQVNVCVTDPPFVLETLLEGTPTFGMEWTNPADPAQTFPGNILDPSAFPPNTTLLLQYSGGLSGSPCFSTNLMEIIILPADANAGDFNSISICETEAQFCMTDSLPGAQAGGVWTDPGGVVVPGCGFNPATMPSGTYTYTITTSCDTDTQDLEITVISLADAGTDGTLTLCSNDTNVPLFGGLGGTPDTPGQWTFGGVNVGPTINGNAVADGDVFTYEVGTGTCANTATVTIDLQTSPSAGVLTTVPQNYCSADAPFNLNDLFTTAPSAGTGSWTGPGGFTGNTLDPGSDLSGIYIFTLTTPNCGSVSTNITINIEATPNAGSNAVVSACPNATGNINLLTVLGADPGGSWTAPPGGPTTGTFTPGSPGGAYVYTLTSTSGNCVSTATATVNLTTLPNAGDGGSITVCATDPCFNLLPNMPGTPAGNGTWFNPGGGFYGPAGAQFCPASGTPGNYSYTVPAPGCPPVTAVLNVTVLPEPNSGTNATITLCENLGSVDLTSYLGGTPDVSGTWDVANPFDISGICGSTQVLTYTVDNGICSSTSNLTLTVECLPDAGLDTDVDLCSAGGTLNLNTILAPGAGTPGTWLNPATAPVTTVPNVPASSGIYTYIATGNTCPDDNASYTLNIYSPITVSNIGANCNAAQTGYTATFEISGGTGNYQVNGNNIAGNTFTSGLLALVNETFIVTDDGPCAQVSVPVQAPDCNCPATASFAGGNQSICAGESVDVSINLIGDGPFTLEYSANGVDQPVLNGINNGHVISLSPAVTTTYEITAVSDANCVGSATSSIVVNVEDPANAGPDQVLELCGSGGNLNLNTVLSGAADFPGNWAPANPIVNNATSNGIYTYTVEGNLCPDDAATYDITIYDPLAAINLTTTCNLAQTQYTVTATITGGSGNFTATNGTMAGNVFTSIAFNAGENYNFTITDTSTPCGLVFTTNGPSPNCDCAATATFSGGTITICQGESTTLPLVLEGVGPWQVTYNNGTADVGPVLVNAGEGIPVTPGATTTYNLVAVSDANCTGSASGSLTVVVDTPPNAGPNVTEILCGGPGNLNLVTLIPTGSGIPTNGTWTGPVPVTGSSVPNNAASSGIYTYELNPNSCPADQATYDITIFNPITVSSVVTACNLAQTEYTVSFTISGGTGNYTVTGSVPGTLTGNTFTSVLIDASLGLGYDFTVSDDGPCADVLVEGDEPSCECLAEGSFTGSGSVCQGSCANITFSGSGVPPFSIVYENSNDPGNPVTLNNVFNNQTIQVCPGTNATYTLLSVTDANCNGTVTGNPVSIAVHEPIVVSNVNPTCDDSGETYTLTFNVTGGVAPFVITPAGGNFNAATGTYTSPPIASGNGYNYTVNDAGACPAVVVSGDPFTCPCTTEAGSIVNTDISACTNEIITVETDEAPELDGNDIYQFVLHNGDADNLGQVLVTSNDGTFSFNPGLQTGVTYYIVALAGNGTVQNNVNLNDPCLSISNAVAVVFNALPTASFGGNVTVCEGQSATLNLSFTGTGPWTYTYSVNGGAASEPVVSAGNNTTISVTEAGTYTISTISDANCTGLGGNQVVVSTFAVPTAAISGDPLVCEGSGDGPTVSFTGNGPWTFEYSINGAIQPLVTTSSNPYTIPAVESGTFALATVSDANCVGTVSGSLEVQYTALPTAQINGGGVVCAGETAPFSLNLSGSGPWTVQYAVDGVPQTPINTNQANYSFMSGAAGTYTVTTVSDQFCSGPGTEGEASLQVNPLPSGEIISSDNLVCIGQDLELTFAMQGVPPFDLTYAINGDTIQLNGIPLTYTITLNPTEPLIAEMIFAADGSNPTCSSTLFNSTFVQVSELPNAPVLVDDTICSGEEPISIGVPAAPGLSYSWSPSSGLSNPNIANPVATLINANLTPKVFTYVVTASNDICSASDTVNITVVPRPRARFLFDPDPVYSEDPTVYFLNKSIVNDNTQFFWDFATLGASTAKNPQFKFPEGRQANYPVTLTAVDMELGCSDTYTAQINVRRELLIYVPNAFTPDGDRKNELWGPVMTNISPDDYLLTVFDRTGNIVFETRDIKQRWNGGMMNGEYYLKPDVYVWTIKGREIGAKDEFEMSGTVTLLR